MKKILTITAVLTLLISSCKETSTSKIEREGEPDVINIADENIAMNQAIAKANKTLSIFKTAIQSNNKNYYGFTLKQKFSDSDGSAEHIWIQDVTYDGSKFKGIVGNTPLYEINVKLGDTINVDESNISDWMYFDQNITKGAYTIRVLRDQMSTEEQKEFDIQSGMQFE
ncbi:MAG: DUF2314 domain-containing protein [Cellulophaga sp.]|uniref:DUF2314 domain-containing protein n=1 Tax=unclassified Cellulophaga TaxID=2634405 RepID=UPI000C2C92B3|nr:MULTISPECIES: DUF2314 domain-containing protein [unclassified Cellulophaga]MDO6491148.1 DUF2314 domain-containing protein [Cellulophaga sp. 2_MG-2023]MDO6495319.1 DUF2314 domain-containing protein [Cellulophaga sp. 3_MG-2023]PKB42883.1 uncharacterized protein YegJ (DUF2314 family) [Cellulophaga sp. RHA19]